MKILSFLLLTFTLNINAVENGAMVKDFKLLSNKNTQVSLSDFKGKTVVLEWFNHGCPFVRKHYDVGNMQGLQKKWMGKDVVWLTINSSAKGKQGYLADATAAANKMKEEKMNSNYLLLDPTGKVGRMLAAKTTPHMYVINKEGKLAYQGAIDSISSASSDDIKKSENYVDSALSSLMKGKKIAKADTKQYGCSVKY